MKPEAAARADIDRQLADAGGIVQDRAAINLAAGPGVAVREFMSLVGPSDSVLFLDGVAAGILEAKKAGTLLSPVESQSREHAAKAALFLKAPILVDFDGRGAPSGRGA